MKEHGNRRAGDNNFRSKGSHFHPQMLGNVQARASKKFFDWLSADYIMLCNLHGTQLI